LSTHKRKQRVKDCDPGLEPPTKTATAGCGWCRGSQSARASAPQKWTTVQRLTGRVDHPANPAVVWRDFCFAQELHPVANCHAVTRGIRKDRTAFRSKAKYLSPRRAITAVKEHPITKGCRVKSHHLGKSAPSFHDPAHPSQGRTSCDFGKKTIEKPCHEILPLFALNSF
jgi:hypothetical protein